MHVSICPPSWAAQVGGAVALTLAFVVPPLIQDEVDKGVANMFDISSPSAAGYAIWQDSRNPDAPTMYFDVYLYNVTNPYEVIAGAKPILQEVGPIQYRIVEIKLNVTWSDDASAVTFMLYRYYEPLVPEQQEIMITSLNLVFQGVAALGGPAAAELLYLFASDFDRLFIRRPVREVFWGYTDPVVGLPFPGIQVNLTSVDAVAQTTGPWTQLTGKHNPAEVRQFTQWNGMTHVECCLQGPCGSPSTVNQSSVPAWGTELANRVRGTYGDQFAGELDPRQTLYVWVDALFRVAPIENVGGYAYDFKGIRLHRYQIPDYAIQNSTLNPDNAAYFMNGPTGTFNISACSGKIPLVISKPHFLDATPGLANETEGIGPPSRELHDTFLDIELTTGLPMNAHERLQVNVQVGPVGFLLPNLRPIIFPVGWIDKHGSASDAQADEFKHTVAVALEAEIGVDYGGIAVAGLCSIVSCGLFLFLWRRLRMEHQEAAKRGEASFLLPGPGGQAVDPSGRRHIQFGSG